MTKSKQTRKKKNRGIFSLKAAVAPEPGNPSVKSVDNILEEAENEINLFNYEKAEELCKETLLIDANNIKGLEMLAGIYIEQFKWKEAEEILLKCIQIRPETGHEKYFSLGQLCNGERSLTLYQKGIQILEKDFENAENDEPQKDRPNLALQKMLSDAYCAIGEIFMTDCCFEENAEEKCKAAIDNAVKSDPSNSEAYQCLANFHLVKEEIDDAKTSLEKSLSLWLPQHEQIRDGESLEQILESNPQFSIPMYDSRIKTGKLLIEMEMFDEATKILDGLVEEDDEVTEVWYLLGWLNYLQGEEYKYNSYYYLNKAKKVGNQHVGDADQMAHIEELLEELKDACPNEENDIEEDYEPHSSDEESETHMMET